MNLTVDIQNASVEPVPEEEDLRSWIATALANQLDTRPPSTGRTPISISPVSVKRRRVLLME